MKNGSKQSNQHNVLLTNKVSNNSFLIIQSIYLLIFSIAELLNQKQLSI